MTRVRITLLIPGHSPPHVTMAARTTAPSKKTFGRGPAIWKAGGSTPARTMASTASLSTSYRTV